MDMYGSSLAFIRTAATSSSGDTGRVLKKASTHLTKQPAGDHVCRGGKRKAQKKSRAREGKEKEKNPAWMVVAARSQALAQLT